MASLSYRAARAGLFCFDAERAHDATLGGLRLMQAVPPVRGLFRAAAGRPDARLTQSLWGLQFKNPIGMAAGFDKNGEAVRGLEALGFGFVELGTVTPLAQPGNERPRMFRVPAEQSVVNCLGFNNQGADALEQKLKKLKSRKPTSAVPLGINLGKNKLTPEKSALEDYTRLVRQLAPYADYLVVNLSSPNTEGLRDLQSASFVRELFAEVVALTQKPTLLKLAPDLEAKTAQELAAVAVAAGAAGLIATNTTNQPALLERLGHRRGGVSGALLEERSRACFDAIAAEVFGEVPLIAVGGLSTVDHVLDRLKLGASLVQIYTALVYEGPGLVARLRRGVERALNRGALGSISELVGQDRRTGSR